jgi:Uma2 family endonuclease
MPKVKKLLQRMTPDEYLEFEKNSPIKHEYVCGQVFAMTGATDAHNVICMSLLAKLIPFLDGTGCRPYMAEMKVHAKQADCFYYPDIMVTCEQVSDESLFKTEPVVIFEVLSNSTHQIDRREKRVAYQNIESLNQYIIVHQKRMQIDVYSRLSRLQWEMVSLHKTGELEITLCQDKILRMAVEAVYKDTSFKQSVNESDDAEYEYGLAY